MNTIEISDNLLRRFVPEAETIRLNQLPKEEELDYNFSDAFENKMKKLISKNKKNQFIFLKYAKRIAVILILVISMAFTTILNVEALRSNFFRMLIKIYSDFTSISFIAEKQDSDFEILYSVPDLPYGYTKIQESQTTTSYSAIYKNGINKIIFEQNYITNNKMILDTEDTSLQTKDFSGYKLYYFSNKGFSQVYWKQDEYMFSLASDLDINMLLELSEKIISEGYNNK